MMANSPQQRPIRREILNPVPLADPLQELQQFHLHIPYFLPIRRNQEPVTNFIHIQIPDPCHRHRSLNKHHLAIHLFPLMHELEGLLVLCQ